MGFLGHHCILRIIVKQRSITKHQVHAVIPGTGRSCGLEESSRHKESTDQSSDQQMQFLLAFGSACWRVGVY